jgi:hypothetical protein
VDSKISNEWSKGKHKFKREKGLPPQIRLTRDEKLKYFNFSLGAKMA